MTNEINYYGQKDNYIHLKFGDCRKKYFFTKELEEKYPDFTEEYTKYFQGMPSSFENPFQVISYVFNNNIPIHFYFNFTDKPATTRQEITDYLLNENDITKIYK